MKKELCITSDFYDDLLWSGRILSEGQIDDMMRYSSSIGATRFEWVLDTLWTLYESGTPMGFDLLQVACEAAHRHGMRFDVVYKPFEGGLSAALPHSFPHADGDRIVKNENGLLFNVRKFVADHPEFRIARRKGDGEDPGGNLAEIRLVKSGEGELLFSPDDISFWHSETNGNFVRYEGKLETSITKEWRLGYPYDDKLCTLLHFKGFDLPQSARFLEVRCAKLNADGSFSNHIESIVELVNVQGEVIPSAPSTLQSNLEKRYSRTKLESDLGISAYLRKPEVRALLENFDTFKEHVETNCRGMYEFEPQWETFTLDRIGAGVIAVCRGKPLCHPIELHPIYPEVRQYWLDEIQYCIDRGVDGVNIRVSRHGCMNEPWAYGFNDPVIEQLENKDDVYEATLVNGRAFDTFLEDAAALLHRHNREIGVHLCGFLLRTADRKMGTTKPSNFVWNWEHWVNDIADYTEFHKTHFHKFPHARGIIDHFAYVSARAGKPLIYQGGQSGAQTTHFDPPHHFLPFEMEWIRDHPNVNCFNLYETALFFRLNEEGTYEGSPEIAKLVKEHWD